MQSQAEPAHDDRATADGGIVPGDDERGAEGSAASEDKAFRKARKQREDELHDEALEETFPASDPPSAKHIT